MTGRIIVGGREVACDAVVKTWHEHGLSFATEGPRTETRAVALHWTGGEGDGRQVHRVLRERHLSVQFCIEHDGTIYQYTDANARCMHAGLANGWSVGIEISNRANGQPHAKWTRSTYLEEVHDKTFRCSRFYAEQIEASIALTKALCRAYGLPFDVPRDSAGELVTTTLGTRELAAYRGVLGHYHVTRRKVDPGTELLRAIAQGGVE